MTRDKVTINTIYMEDLRDEKLKLENLELVLEGLAGFLRLMGNLHHRGILEEAGLEKDASEVLDHLPALLDLLGQYCHDRK